MKTKQIKEYIRNALDRYSNETVERNLEDMHSRLDELFLLWSNITKINFMDTCKYFGVNYDEFDRHNHFAVINQLRKLKEVEDKANGN